MNKLTKARKYNSSKIQSLLNDLTPLEMEQTKVKMQLAGRIEDLTKAKGWNNSQLADHIGKNPSEITKWFSGTQNFTIDILTEISTVLGVELASFFDKQKFQTVYRSQPIIKNIAALPTIQIQTPLGSDGSSYSDYPFGIERISILYSQGNPA